MKTVLKWVLIVLLVIAIVGVLMTVAFAPHKRYTGNQRAALQTGGRVSD